MKAPIAQAGGEAASPPGCDFIFFWGLEIVKFILKNSDLLGPVVGEPRGGGNDDKWREKRAWHR
jgi:hypothetical protein